MFSCGMDNPIFVMIQLMTYIHESQNIWIFFYSNVFSEVEARILFVETRKV